jgi:hypothetical protein
VGLEEETAEHMEQVRDEQHAGAHGDTLREHGHHERRRLGGGMGARRWMSSACSTSPVVSGHPAGDGVAPRALEAHGSASTTWARTAVYCPAPDAAVP